MVLAVNEPAAVIAIKKQRKTYDVQFDSDQRILRGIPAQMLKPLRKTDLVDASPANDDSGSEGDRAPARTAPGAPARKKQRVGEANELGMPIE